nr:hypothetical protein [Tanacetum cinerariifolium]
MGLLVSYSNPRRSMYVHNYTTTTFHFGDESLLHVHRTTEVLEVFSPHQRGVYPIQVCTALKYLRGYSSWQPKSVATESAHLYVARMPKKSIPADSILQLSHPVVCTALKYLRGYSSWQPKSVATESAHLYVAEMPKKSIPADSILQLSHPVESQPTDLAPHEPRPVSHPAKAETRDETTHSTLHWI